MGSKRFQVWQIQEGNPGFNDYRDDDEAEGKANHLKGKEAVTDILIVDTHTKLVSVLKGSVEPFETWLGKRVPGWRLNGRQEE